jgi:hypothetical protein
MSDFLDNYFWGFGVCAFVIWLFAMGACTMDTVWRDEVRKGDLIMINKEVYKCQKQN